MKFISKTLMFLTMLTLNQECLPRVTSQLKNKRVKYAILGGMSGLFLSKFMNKNTIYFGPFSKLAFADENTDNPLLLTIPILGAIFGLYISKYNTPDYFLDKAKNMLSKIDKTLETVKEFIFSKDDYTKINNYYFSKEFVNTLKRHLKELSKIEEYLENAIGNKEEGHWLVVESKKCLLQVIENEKLLKEAILILS